MRESVEGQTYAASSSSEDVYAKCHMPKRTGTEYSAASLIRKERVDAKRHHLRTG